MVKCQTIMDAMERIAPRALAEDWDNPGLLVGSPRQEISRVLVCLDVSESVLQLAVENGCNLIVAHHPLIFKPMKKLRTDLPLGHLLQELLRKDIAVYAAHTNLDIVQGGVMMCSPGVSGSVSWSRSSLRSRQRDVRRLRRKALAASDNCHRRWILMHLLHG